MEWMDNIYIDFIEGIIHKKNSRQTQPKNLEFMEQSFTIIYSFLMTHFEYEKVRNQSFHVRNGCLYLQNYLLFPILVVTHLL